MMLVLGMIGLSFVFGFVTARMLHNIRHPTIPTMAVRLARQKVRAIR